MRYDKVVFIVTGVTITVLVAAMFAWSVATFNKRCGQCAAALPCPFVGPWLAEYSGFLAARDHMAFASPDVEEWEFLQHLVKTRVKDDPHNHHNPNSMQGHGV